jgi:hypothetical protein
MALSLQQACDVDAVESWSTLAALTTSEKDAIMSVVASNVVWQTQQSIVSSSSSLTQAASLLS